MLRSAISMSLSLIGCVVMLASCDAPEPPEPHLARRYDPIELSTVVNETNRFHGVPVRLSGVVQLEFEGNALYVDATAHEKRDVTKALWLAVGWPPQLGSPELNGRRVVVEGTVDANSKGHERAFAGSLTQIQRLDLAQ